MHMLNKALFTFCLLSVSSGTALQAQENSRFIEGFPDVPYMDFIERIDDEPMVFDTASGTVAEATVFFSVSANQAMLDYQAALTGLGWTCEKTEAELSCIRENTIVSFAFQTNTQTGSSFILRLEPRR